jgi:hypothetical protein
MRFLLPVVTLMVFSAAALADVSTLPALPPPPVPEQYINDGHYSEYAQAAEAFLRDQPDSTAASRVAMDLLQAATASDDGATVVQMQRLLIMRYPTSMQTRFIIMSMADGQQFAQMMASVSADNFEDPPPDFVPRYDAAMRLGVNRFGAAAMGDGAQLARTILLARMVGDSQLIQVGVRLLNLGGQRELIWASIVGTVADDSKPIQDRLDSLHALPYRAAVVPFERFLLSRLADKDRQAPAAMRIEADDLLVSSNLADAQPLLDKLCNGPTEAEPRIQFWRAWATAAGGNVVAADQQLRRLASQHPDDPWGKEAADLAPTVGGVDANLAANVEAALALSRRFKRGITQLEGHASFQTSDGQKMSLYAGINSPDLMELLLQHGTDTVLAYRVTDQDCSIYVQGDTEISHYTKPLFLPTPRLDLSRAGADYHFSGHLVMANTFAELENALSGLLANDILSTRDGVSDVLRYFVRKGIFPLNPAPAADGATVYTWVVPSVDSPNNVKASFTITSNGALTGFQSGNFTITDLRFGPPGTMTVSPPPLPSIPTADKGPMSNAVLSSVLGKTSAVLFPPPATQPAAAAK